jgi:hypothetical protein
LGVQAHDDDDHGIDYDGGGGVDYYYYYYHHHHHHHSFAHSRSMLTIFLCVHELKKAAET